MIVILKTWIKTCKDFGLALVIICLGMLFPPPSDGNWSKWHKAMLDPLAPTNLYMDEYNRKQNQENKPKSRKILLISMAILLIFLAFLTYWWYYA